MTVQEEASMDSQNSWEDYLERDSKPKFKFPVNFSEEKLEGIVLEFPKLELKDPTKPKDINRVKTIKLNKKTKGGIF